MTEAANNPALDFATDRGEQAPRSTSLIVRPATNERPSFVIPRQGKLEITKHQDCILIEEEGGVMGDDVSVQIGLRHVVTVARAMLEIAGFEEVEIIFGDRGGHFPSELYDGDSPEDFDGRARK